MWVVWPGPPSGASKVWSVVGVGVDGRVRLKSSVLQYRTASYDFGVFVSKSISALLVGASSSGSSSLSVY